MGFLPQGAAGALLLALGAGPALASGGFDCSASDGKVKLAVSGGVSRGLGGRPFNVEGTLEVLKAKVAADFRKVAFTGDDLAQNWLDGRELRLRLYRERAGDTPHGYVEIAIVTRAKDELDFAGTYTVEVYEADTGSDGKVTIKGKVACSVE
ncbi:hypothetical protein [Ancylobacter terrae]|uniref:hypothetical protein n=1 Tax=Ancylobacter sp. sgz301288 TaxID=3342077 RepID=UPI00385C9410